MSFNGKGFYKFTDKIVSSSEGATIEIEVKLTTSSSDGLLLWKRSERYQDYISLGLKDGFVKLEYFYSEEKKKVTVFSVTRIDDGSEHSVKITKENGGSSTLQIDADEPVLGAAQVRRDLLNTKKAPLFLGGLSPDDDFTKSTLGLYSNGLSGCISFLSFVNTVGGSTWGLNSQDSGFYAMKDQGGNIVDDIGGDVDCVRSCTGV